jgi:hypothetical protein
MFRIHRKLQGEGEEEGEVRGRIQVHRLRFVLEHLPRHTGPGKEDDQARRSGRKAGSLMKLEKEYRPSGKVWKT